MTFEKPPDGPLASSTDVRASFADVPDAPLASFAEFTQRRLPALLRFATMLCIDPGLAEDLVQEVLLKAHNRWTRLDALEHPEAYVRRMIVNEFVSWRRKWSRLVPSEILELPSSAPDHAEGVAERDALFRRLVRLPARQRAVIVLRYYGGLTDPEIARELGCAAGTVRSLASRAFATLRVELTAPPVPSLREA